MLPGRKSVFRAGFLPDCYRESTEIRPPAGRRDDFGALRVAVRPKFENNSNPGSVNNWNSMTSLGEHSIFGSAKIKDYKNILKIPQPYDFCVLRRNLLKALKAHKRLIKTGGPNSVCVKARVYVFISPPVPRSKPKNQVPCERHKILRSF